MLAAIVSLMLTILSAGNRIAGATRSGPTTGFHVAQGGGKRLVDALIRFRHLNHAVHRFISVISRFFSTPFSETTL